MTVKAIRLKNFMAFEDTDWLELRPISLLFGRNSSGKSAVIRALRLLKQSLDAPDGRGDLLFSSPQGVNLGPYWETVHRIPGQGKPQEGEKLPRMAFGFRCELPESLDELWGLLGQYLSDLGEEIPARDYLPDVVEVELVFEAGRSGEQAGLSEVQISCATVSNGVTRSYNVFSALRLDRDDAYAFGEEWWFASDLPIIDSESGGDLWRGWEIDTENGFLPRLVPTAPKAVTQNQHRHMFIDRLLLDVKTQVMHFLRRIVHLGPMRPHPRRTFAFERVDLDALSDAGWRGMVRLLREDVNEDALKGIDAWLRTTELARELLPDGLSKTVDVGVLTQISIEEESGLLVNLADVGFGMSQVIPILVECFTAEKDELIIIEQPELHLHPRAQAELGDLFILTAKQGVRFLIETHSEHLLLRLRRRIADSTLNQIKALRNAQPSPEQYTHPDLSLAAAAAAVYFIERTNGISTVESVLIDERGEYTLTPEGFSGFFSNDFEEVLQINLAIAEMNNLVESHASDS